MNATQRAKVAALRRLRIPARGWGGPLIANLAWRLDHEPDAPLSPKERWLLDRACWHYRRSLGGRVSFDLPLTEPELRDYLPRLPPPRQKDLPI